MTPGVLAQLFIDLQGNSLNLNHRGLGPVQPAVRTSVGSKGYGVGLDNGDFPDAHIHRGFPWESVVDRMELAAYRAGALEFGE